METNRTPSVFCVNLTFALNKKNTLSEISFPAIPKSQSSEDPLKRCCTNFIQGAARCTGVIAPEPSAHFRVDDIILLYYQPIPQRVETGLPDVCIYVADSAARTRQLAIIAIDNVSIAGMSRVIRLLLHASVPLPHGERKPRRRVATASLHRLPFRRSLPRRTDSGGIYQVLSHTYVDEDGSSESKRC